MTQIIMSQACDCLSSSSIFSPFHSMLQVIERLYPKKIVKHMVTNNKNDSSKPQKISLKDKEVK